MPPPRMGMAQAIKGHKLYRILLRVGAVMCFYCSVHFAMRPRIMATLGAEDLMW